MPNNKTWQIAIDGPAGVGKSTVSRLLAQKLNFTYIDTGAMYRCIALKMIQNAISESDTKQIIKITQESQIEFENINNEQHVILNNIDVTQDIRSNEVNKIVSSTVAPIQEVRRILVERQKNLASLTNVVMDGRDIGTTVLPQATLKIFLEASIETRAKRRHIQNLQSNIESNVEELKSILIARDESDRKRQISPLVPANDAEIVYTDNLTQEEVIDVILTKFNSKKAILTAHNSTN